MTAAALNPAAEYNGNGVTTAFMAEFRFLAGSLEVDLIADDGTVARQTLGVHYSVTGGLTDAGGTVTMVTAPAAGTRLRIRRNTPRAQETDYETNDNFPASTAEGSLDRAMLIDQEQDVKIADTATRALLVPDGEAAAEIPAASTRASRVGGYDASGDPVAGPLLANLETVVTAALSSLSIGEVSSVATIAAMQAILKATLTDGDVVNVLGRLDALDGGGGLFRWVEGDVTTVDGGTVFAAGEGGAGRWKRVDPGAISLAEFGAVGDYDFGTEIGTDNAVAIANAIAFMKLIGGGKLSVPRGNFLTSAAHVVDFDGLIIEGEGQEHSNICVQHDGIAISYTSAVPNLPNAKFSVNRLKIVNVQGYPLDPGGFPQATHQGTGMKLFECFGSSFTDLLIEGFDRSLHFDDCALIEFYNFTDRNCWTGRYFEGFTNQIAFRGGIVNNSSINTDRDDVKAIIFDSVDIEAASQPIVLGDGAIFDKCRIERLHISRAWFRWFQINGDENRFIGGTRMFWDGSAEPGAGENDFFIEVAGNRNVIEVPYVYNHEKVIRFAQGTKNNVVRWSAQFDDYANTGNNDLYRFSRRFLVDGGLNNRVEWITDDSRMVTQGHYSQRADGALHTYLRYEVLANLTISGGAGLVIAASDIIGPFDIPAANVNVKKFTLDPGAIHRASVAPAGLAGDGTTKFVFSAWIYIPEVDGPTRVRLGIGDGTFVNLYKTDGSSKWHNVIGFYQLANAAAAAWMIEADGADGNYFYVAFPSLADNLSPSFIDRDAADTTNTLVTATSFDSALMRYTMTLA